MAWQEMVDRTKRILLITFGCVVMSVSLAAFTASLIVTPRVNAESLSVAVPTKIPDEASDKQNTLDAQQFQYVWRKSLQKPLVDAIPVAKPDKPPEKAVPVEKISGIEATLVGTLVDPDPKNSRAWVEFRGERIMLELGDALDGHAGNPSVTEILDEEIRFQIGTDVHTLRVQNRSALNFMPAEASNAN